MTKVTGRAAALPKVIPERIREAREACGLSLDMFAIKLGISRQAVAQFETGQNGPSAETFSQIITITGQPPSFFTKSRRRKGGSVRSPFWRSLKRMENADRARVARRIEWAADIVDYVESYVSLPTPNIPDLQWHSDGNNAEDIEQIALRLRTEWKIGNGPIHDLVKLLEANGIILVRETVLSDDMDAVSTWQAGRPYILYAAEVESAPRVNFNLAHELGHLLLHSDIEVSSDNLSRLEKQANRFAGAFLLPRPTFSSEVISTSLNYFEQLKKRWHVAIAAMVYRCKDLGILTGTQVNYLWRQMNAKGIRRIEPLDDAFEHCQPGLLKAALEMLVVHRVQTKADIEEAINLNASDIESLGGTEEGWLAAEKIIAFGARPTLKMHQNA